MADVKAVPAGKYGKAALEALGVWAAVEGKVAQAENVRAALKLVATGEAALGIVYQTDANAEPAVKVLGTFPANTHEPIVYPVGADRFFHQSRCRGIPEVSAVGQGEVAFRGAGLHVPGGDRLQLRMDWVGLSAQEWTAVRLSVKVAIWAMVASLPPGILIATLLARGRFWGKSVVNGIVHLPLVLPPVVTGYLLLLTFGRRAPVGAFLADNFGIVFSFRWTGAALASRDHGLSPDGAGDPPFPGGGGPETRGGRRHAGSESRLGVPDGDPAADVARHPGRHGAVVRQGDG